MFNTLLFVKKKIAMKDRATLRSDPSVIAGQTGRRGRDSVLDPLPLPGGHKAKNLGLWSETKKTV